MNRRLEPTRHEMAAASAKRADSFIGFAPHASRVQSKRRFCLERPPAYCIQHFRFHKTELTAVHNHTHSELLKIKKLPLGCHAANH
jgi:hypothetical protein